MGPDKLFRFDMSEYQNQESLGLLLGAKLGERGTLALAYDKSRAGTLLFDEIEKAHARILDIFLQILDAARVTMASGETLDFSGFYVVFTSNIASSEIVGLQHSSFATMERHVLTHAQRSMRPELYARINEKLVFNKLTYDVQLEIAQLLLHVQDQDDFLVMPITTAQKRVTGMDWLDDVYFSATRREDIPEAAKRIIALVRERHHLRPGEDDDFNIRTPEEIIRAQLAAANVFTILLGSAASLSLLVGGIGIMNIMMVSVTERTREIGVRMAIGATDRDIQMQFLSEAIVMSLIGGVLGVAAGIAGSFFCCEARCIGKCSSH